MIEEDVNHLLEDALNYQKGGADEESPNRRKEMESQPGLWVEEFGIWVDGIGSLSGVSCDGNGATGVVGEE